MEVNEESLLALGFVEIDKEDVWKSKNMQGKMFALINRGHQFRVEIKPNGENEFYTSAIYASAEGIVKYNIYRIEEMLGIIADCFIQRGKNEKIKEIKAVLEIK